MPYTIEFWKSESVNDNSILFITSIIDELKLKYFFIRETQNSKIKSNDSVNLKKQDGY